MERLNERMQRLEENYARAVRELDRTVRELDDLASKQDRENCQLRSALQELPRFKLATSQSDQDFSKHSSEIPRKARKKVKAKAKTCLSADLRNYADFHMATSQSVRDYSKHSSEIPRKA